MLQTMTKRALETLTFMQHADDTCVYLNGSNSLANFVKRFEDFYQYAGLKI